MVERRVLGLVGGGRSSARRRRLGRGGSIGSGSTRTAASAATAERPSPLGARCSVGDGSRDLRRPRRGRLGVGRLGGVGAGRHRACTRRRRQLGLRRLRPRSLSASASARLGGSASASAGARQPSLGRRRASRASDSASARRGGLVRGRRPRWPRPARRRRQPAVGRRCGSAAQRHADVGAVRRTQPRRVWRSRGDLVLVVEPSEADEELLVWSISSACTAMVACGSWCGDGHAGTLSGRHTVAHVERSAAVRRAFGTVRMRHVGSAPMQEILDAIQGGASGDDIAALPIPETYRAALVLRDEQDDVGGGRVRRTRTPASRCTSATSPRPSWRPTRCTSP